MTQRSLLAFLLACVLVACGSEGSPTAIDVTVVSDLTVPDELDRLTLNVEGQERAEDPTADLRAKPLPRAIRLLHDGGPLGPVRITLRGWRGAVLVVEHDVAASFTEGAVSALTVRLERVCASVLCPAGQTCSGGACGPVAGADGGAADGGLDGAVGSEAGAAEAGAASDGAAGDGGASAADASFDLDAGAPDGGALDAGAQDAGTSDAAVADAGTPPDAGTSDAALPDAGTSDAALPDAGTLPPDAGAPAGAAPSCTISLPTLDGTYQAGATLSLEGSCTDPETGALSSGLSWSSNRDGALANGASARVSLRSLGAHTLSLCAPDPRDPSLVGCGTTRVTVTLVGQPTASITALTQAGSAAQPFVSGPLVLATGVGTGAGVALSWSDDLDGALGTGPSIDLPTAHVGRHTLTLTVRDRQGAVRTATRSYVVVAPGEASLVSSLTQVNATVDQAGSLVVSTLAVDAQLRVYVPSSSGVLFRFDGASLGSNATIAVGQPPLQGIVTDAFIDPTHQLGYLATDNGLAVCAFTSAVGVAQPCSTFVRGNLPSQNLLSVLRLSEAAGADSLVLGTRDGLLVASDVRGSATGTVALRGRSIADMAALGGRAALATDRGLWFFTPSSALATRVTGDPLQSAQLTSLALATDGALWIGGSAGLYRYAPSSGAVTEYNAQSGLGASQVRGVAVQSAQLGGVTRDLVWIATSAGLARLDTLTATFARFTTSDGLPSNDVRAVQVLANGTKVLGTARGLAHYVGY